MIARYAAISVASCASVVASSRSDGVAARRKRIRLEMSRAASGAPCSASCCALPSVLNRKCGSICSCSSAASTRRAAARARSAALGLEMRRERPVLAVAQAAISADDERVQRAEHQSGDDDVAHLRAVLEEHEWVRYLSVKA